MKTTTVNKILEALKTYPKDIGSKWGYGPLLNLRNRDVTKLIQTNPEVVLEFG